LPVHKSHIRRSGYHIDGAPATIVGYQLFAAAQPFSRADIRNGTIPLIGTSSGPSIEITPAAGSQYYSVVVVDAKGNLSPF